MKITRAFSDVGITFAHRQVTGDAPPRYGEVAAARGTAAAAVLESVASKPVP